MADSSALAARPDPVLLLDLELIEKAAQALFEAVFSRCTRKRYWEDCDEETKRGFRGEAAAVIRVLASDSSWHPPHEYPGTGFGHAFYFHSPTRLIAVSKQ
jgi:hypothetical protein